MFKLLACLFFAALAGGSLMLLREALGLTRWRGYPQYHYTGAYTGAVLCVVFFVFFAGKSFQYIPWR